MTTTTELHAVIAQMQVLIGQAADRIAHFAEELAKSHTVDGIVKDLDVQLMLESDADLIDHLRAAALPWDQRHKSTERPQSRAHQFPANQVEAVRAELQEAVEAHGLTAKPEPTDSMGMPISCSKPLCSPGDHHPLCKLAEQPTPIQSWKLVPVEPTADMWKAVNKLDDEMAAGSYDGKGCSIEQAWDCLLAAAPQPQQEPVGYVAENGLVDWNLCAPPIFTDLYTSPSNQPGYQAMAMAVTRLQKRCLELEGKQPARKPLMEEQITAFWETRPYFNDFARAIEAAHQIGVEK